MSPLFSFSLCKTGILAVGSGLGWSGKQGLSNLSFPSANARESSRFMSPATIMPKVLLEMIFSLHTKEFNLQQERLLEKDSSHEGDQRFHS